MAVRGWVVVLAALSAGVASGQSYNVLLYTRTSPGAFRHASIPAGIQAINELGQEYGFNVYATEDQNYLTDENLAQYDVAVFLSSAGNQVEVAARRESFENFIRSGKGFVGIHSATSHSSNWSWYLGLLGGKFNGHPAIQEATIWHVDEEHRSTQHLGSTWTWTDEWYEFTQFDPTVNVLLEVDETTYNGGATGAVHPIAWYHNYDGGRSWYTSLGHESTTYSDPAFRKHIAEGILWAARPEGDYNRDNRVDAGDYVAWRNRLGEEGKGLPADGNGDEIADVEDYLIWKSAYGGGISGSLSEGSGVPEPAAVGLAVIAATVLLSASARHRLIASGQVCAGVSMRRDGRAI